MLTIKLFGNQRDEADFVWVARVHDTHDQSGFSMCTGGSASSEEEAKKQMAAKLAVLVERLQFGETPADPKTSDYCAVCGESPESGSHGPFADAHPYVYEPAAARLASANFARTESE
jgi:hypothetical protein